jgi:dolichol-phosphate mannosyltransferase
MKNSITVILSTLNEQENIILLIKKINKIVNPKQIIVVDGGSCDKTCDLVEHDQLRHKNILLIKNKSGLGLTDSINKGVSIAKTPIVVWMDTDLSHPPETIKSMYKKIVDHDAVIGSWLIKGGKDSRKNKLEVFRSKIINNICQLIFGKRITTYTSGFIMIKRTVLKKYKFEGDYGEYFIHLCTYLIRNNIKIIEVPFNCKSRIYGKSKTSPNLLILLKRALKYIVMIKKLA